MINITFQHGLEIIIGCLFALFIIRYKFKPQDRLFLIAAFFSAFIFRVIFSIFLVFTVTDYQTIFLLHDDISYDEVAREIAEKLSNNEPAFITSYSTGYPNPGYYNFGGFAYYFLNFDTFSMRILNILISSFAILPIYKMIKENLGEKNARLTIVLYVIFPMFVLYSGLHIKDIIVDFFFVLIFLHVLRILNRNYGFWDIFLFLIYLTILFYFRRDLALLIASFIFVILFFFNNSNSAPIFKLHHYLKIAMMMIVILMILIILFFNFETGRTVLWSIIFRFSQQVSFIESSGGGVLGLLRVGSFLDIYKIPLGMVFSVLAPLPGSIQLGSRIDVLPFYHSIGNIFNILILPFAAVGFFKIPIYLKNLGQDLLLRWLPFGLWIVIAVLNLGSVRYSLTIWVFCLIWSSVGLMHIHKNKFFYIFYYLAVIAILPLIYIKLYI
jgi:hypothetical protein